MLLSRSQLSLTFSLTFQMLRSACIRLEGQSFQHLQLGGSRLCLLRMV